MRSDWLSLLLRYGMFLPLPLTYWVWRRTHRQQILGSRLNTQQRVALVLQVSLAALLFSMLPIGFSKEAHLGLTRLLWLIGFWSHRSEFYLSFFAGAVASLSSAALGLHRGPLRWPILLNGLCLTITSLGTWSLLVWLPTTRHQFFLL